MDRLIKVGIVGCGAISDVHVKSYLEISGVEVVAVSDINEKAARSVAEKYKWQWYTDYKEMICKSGADVIDICTPSGLRKDIAIYAAKNKKHIIAEKPIEVTLDRIDSILEACSENQVFISGIFNKRYKDIYRQIKNIIQENRLGKIILSDVSMKWYRPAEYYKNSGWRGTWALDGGGALMNQCIHYVDMLQWLLGAVDNVFGQTDKFVHTYIEAEDTAAALLRFKSGAIGMIQAATSTYPGFSARFSINGENGGIVIEDDKVIEFKCKDQRPEDDLLFKANQANIGASTNIVTNYGLHKSQLTAILASIREGKEPEVNGIEARKAVEIIEAIYMSSVENRQVKLPL
jgi:predicted dehydrogenase